MGIWDPYRPTAENPWDWKKVGHLYRRTGFGATYAELEQGVKDGPTRTLERVLTGGPKNAEFERTSAFMASERSLTPGSPVEPLAAWWLYRMLHSPHPLQEKLTLFWHNHFATSLVKVQNARYMLHQYEILNKHALGSFRNMLHEITLDPAMMIWLDTRDSRKGMPNENYARELMELFSLGIGHYTETDIREAAKSFTGYDIHQGKARFDRSKHDTSEKRVLGRKGTFAADDIVDICLDQKACPQFIVKKLYRYLVSETRELSDKELAPLVDLYRQSGLDTGKLVATILKSQHFFSADAYRQRVKSPVDFALSIIRSLEGNVGLLPLAGAMESLGQVLFAPPSVKGWDGGTTWLNAQSLLYRQNLALALTSTEDTRFGRRCDPVVVLKRYDRGNLNQALDFFLTIFLQRDLPAESHDKLKDYMITAKQVRHPAFWSQTDVEQHQLRTLAHLTLTLPEFQLD